jgi:hypothetical protein
MKKRLLYLIVILFAISGWSQNGSQNDYSVSINGNRITTTANFKRQVEELKKSTNKQSAKTEYTLLQFTKIPSLDEQQKLKKQGITLLSYLSNNAYYASVNSQFYARGTVSDNIRTKIDIDPKYKLDPTVALGEIPDYASEGNAVKVVVSYFKGAPAGTISNDLVQFKARGVKNLESFGQVYLTVSKDRITELAKLNWVQNIDLVPPPVVSDNLPGRSSNKSNVLNSSLSGLGYTLTGKGVKVGIWDGNLEPHKDHTGRVKNKEYESASSHGDHVSGTIGGAGLLDPKARGMAAEVQMFGWNFNVQSNNLPVYAEREISALEDGIEITSNSYGYSNTGGYSLRRYDTSDNGDDALAIDFPYLLNIYSNGNDQTKNPGGFNTTTKNSKNALHVAANDPNDRISNYSSFGPTIDGRLLPQISAVGTDVYSLDYNNSYQVMSGTSMATPATTGTVALLYERYKSIYGEKPLASLMKALVANTAKDVGNAGPDYKYGFGNLNGLRAVKALDKKWFYSASVVNGAVSEKEIIVPAGLVSLKVMMAYSDLAGTPGAPNVQVNDLDITIVKDGQTIMPWILNPGQPNAIATRGVDAMNNIEQITIDNPTAGRYKIIVKGKLVPLNAQQFSVVYDYVAPDLILTYPLGGEKINPDTTEYIRWDYEGVPKTFTIEYSIDGGANYKIIAENVPADARNFAWHVPADITISANTKIRVSAGTKVSTSKGNFTIMNEPKNLMIADATCGTSSYKLEWDAIAGAKYEVLRLNGFQFDVVATVTEPSYTFDNLTAGDNNWFSVRAIDIATNTISERVRAVNVEPIAKPVFSAATLPLLEDFNERKGFNCMLSQASATGAIGYGYINNDLLDGVNMSGSGTPSPAAWVASTTSDAFTNNPSFIKRVSFCDIEATAVAGKPVRLKFNLLWKGVAGYLTGANSSPVIIAENKAFFRVLVNGVPVKSIDGTEVYGGPLSGEKELTYDLAGVVGNNFNVVLEGVVDNDVINNATSSPIYNVVQVDNVSFYEATKTDLGVSALIPNTGLTATETVTVSVYNYSPVAISNIPVSYKVDDKTEVIETIPGPIAPLTSGDYSFATKADYTAGGLHTVVAKVNHPDDAILENNSKTATVGNPGADILIGSSSLVTTCSATFTDSGSRYEDYKIDLLETTTFAPAVAGNKIKVVFSEYASEKGYDFLYVYNGPTDASPLLGKFDSGTKPTVLTSTAAGGELTFKFTSDEGVNDSGWVADISCVAPVGAVADAAILSIVSPVTLGLKTSATSIDIQVKNTSTLAATNVPVFYIINDDTKVTDVIPAIAAGATLSFSFATKADLSIKGAKYVIKAGIDQVDADLTNNEKTKTVYNRNDLPVHTNTDGYAITKFKWNDVVNNSGVTAYSDFKNVKIPVFAGIPYQPEVTTSRPDAPLISGNSATPGAFTMIVIDLNNDGNLTDEFYAGVYWINTLTTTAAPYAATPSLHYFSRFNAVSSGVTIPTTTLPGEKLMRVLHMYRAPQNGYYEGYNVNLGPTLNNVDSSRDNFEVEEYTIDVLPFTAANASVEAISAPMKPGLKPVVVSATIRNYSAASINNFPIAYRINGGEEVVENVTTALLPRATATFTFATKADLSLPADYTIEVYTKLPGDTDSTNDLKSVSFTHASNSITNNTGSFDGVDDYLKIDAIPSLNLVNNYTFETWINQKSSSVFGRIIDKSTVLMYVHNDYNKSLYKENSLVLSVTTATGSYVLNTGENSVQQNKWQHVALTVSASNVYTIYIDGVVAPYTSTGVAAAAKTNATAPAYVGNNAGLARGFNGNIDEVRIWSGVLDQATIAANTMIKLVGNEAGLLAYYSFSENDKKFAFDASAKDNTAVVTNADTNGMGEGKFWNTPVLLTKLDLVNQLANSYDAATKTYTVLLDNSADVTKTIANFSAGMSATVKVNGIDQVSGVTMNDCSTPVTFTVEGVGFNTGITETYVVKVLTGLSAKSELIAYDFNKASNSGLTKDVKTTISGSNATTTVAYGTNLSALKANFTVSAGATVFIDQVKQVEATTAEQDYSNDVLVTVVSENKLSKTNYVISLDARNTESDIVNFGVNNVIGSFSKNSDSKAIKIYVDNNAVLSSLTPSFQVSEQAVVKIGTILQESGVTTLNYTAPVTYAVIAQNGTITNWTVTIERAKPTITLLGDTVVSLNKGCVYTDAGFTAKDNLNTDIAAGVVTSGTVDVNTPGQYTLTYTAKDALNNESSVTRTVNVSSVTCALGVVTNAIDGFVVYPNPVKDDKVNIVTPSNGMKNIRISDISGKKVLSLQTVNKELNLPNLPKGVYIIKVEQDGKTSTQKLIVE